jgi:hypothetical protein
VSDNQSGLNLPKVSHQLSSLETPIEFIFDKLPERAGSTYSIAIQRQWSTSSLEQAASLGFSSA